MAPIAAPAAAPTAEPTAGAAPSEKKEKIEYDFIRSFGAVRRRRLGAIQGVTGESVYCDLRNLVRFRRAIPEVVYRDPSGSDLILTGAHRRFYNDGRAMGRFEIGFKMSWRAPTTFRWDDPIVIPPEGVGQIIRFVLESPISVADHYTPPADTTAKRKRMRHELPLAGIGPSLASAFLRASTKDKAIAASGDAHSWWVRVGAPVVFVSYALGELERLPVSATTLETFGAPAKNATAAQDDRPCISLDKHALDRESAPRVWYIRQGNDSAAARDAARRARIHLMRFASESEGATGVIRLIQLGKIALVRSQNVNDPSDRLQRYLGDAIGFLKRKVQDSMANDPLYQALVASAETVPIDDIDSLANAIRDARRSVKRQIQEYVKEVTNYYAGDHVEGNKNEINASQGGVVSGVNQVVAGGDVTATASGQVTQMTAQMKKLFDNLQEEVDKATATASPADKAAVQKKVDEFQADVKKGKANRKWYDVSAKGLLEAVAAVGGIVSPIGAIVAKIVAMVV